MAALDELTAAAVRRLPASPAVYALYGGRNTRAYVAYVGMALNLRKRIFQHLVARDSSVTTGVSAVGLKPEYVTEIRWWEHPQFTDRSVLRGAELVAFEVLNPALRSRGGSSTAAKSLQKNETFQSSMRELFIGNPTDTRRLPDLRTLLKEVSNRVAKLEKQIEGKSGRAHA